MRRLPDVKVCAVCGASFRREDGEKANRWRDRKTCSPECTSRLRTLNARAAAMRRDECPTPEQIAERAAAIRAENRYGRKRRSDEIEQDTHWTPPLARVPPGWR